MREWLRLIFDAYDTDGSRTLDLAEMTNLISRTFNYDLPTSQAQAMSMITFMDRDGNGRLDFEEFVAGVLGNPVLQNALVVQKPQQASYGNPYGSHGGYAKHHHGHRRDKKRY